MTALSERSTQLDGQEISRLVTAASQQDQGDVYRGKRRSPRFLTGMQLEAVFDPSDTSDSFSVIMHNVSETGLAFWARREIHPGTDVYLREFSDDDVRAWIGAHVIHRTPGIRGFLIGAQFHRPLASGELEPPEEELVGVGHQSQASVATSAAPPPDLSSKRRGLLGWLGWGRKDD